MENIVIDVEMCHVQKSYEWKDYPYDHEIIQIGAVRMDGEYELSDDFSSYVRPRYGKIDHFIQDLTGINENDIIRAMPLAGVLENMKTWIGSDEVMFYAWSMTDYTQIVREIRAKGIDVDQMSVFLDRQNWTDYQQVAGKRFGKQWRMALEDALMLAEIEPEGKQHDGLADARNTARLIVKMQKHPDSRFLQDRLDENCHKETIGSSLADMLKGIGVFGNQENTK